MKSHWMEHQGKRIFFADYSGFGADNVSLQAEVEQAISMLATEPQKSALVLANFEGTEPSFANLNVIRRLVPRANHAVIKRALLGLSGPSKFFITTFSNVTGGTPVVAFENRENALEWLTGIKATTVEAMVMKSRWQMHQGVQVFIADFSQRGSNAAEIAAECEAIKQELHRRPPHSVLSISYVEGTLATEDIITHLVELVKTTNQYIKKRAVVGVSGYRKHLLYAFSKVVGDLNFNVFDSLDEALDWLVK